MKTSALIFCAGLALLIYGCSSSNDQTSSSTSSTASTGTSGAPSSTTGTPPANNATSTTGATTSGSTASASTAGYAGVQAIFNKSCMPCHAAGHPRGGVDLTSYDSVMKGGEKGPIVKAGDPNGSLLIDYITGKKQPRMPKNAPPLSDSDVKTITDWIQAGAKND